MDIINRMHCGYMCKRKIKIKLLHRNNSNICIEMFNEIITSYFIIIVVVLCAIKIDIVTNPKLFKYG